jgi:hypothetical protein
MHNNNQNKKAVNLYLSEDLVEQIRDLADKDMRSLSAYITVILKKHLSNNKDTE